MVSIRASSKIAECPASHCTQGRDFVAEESTEAFKQSAHLGNPVSVCPIIISSEIAQDPASLLCQHLVAWVYDKACEHGNMLSYLSGEIGWAQGQVGEAPRYLEGELRFVID